MQVRGMQVSGVNLATEDWQRLDELASVMARTRSDALRQLIRRDRRIEELVTAYCDDKITARELAENVNQFYVSALIQARQDHA